MESCGYDIIIIIVYMIYVGAILAVALKRLSEPQIAMIK